MIQAKGYAAQGPEAPLTPWQFERREVGAHDGAASLFDATVGRTETRSIRESGDPFVPRACPRLVARRARFILLGQVAAGRLQECS